LSDLPDLDLQETKDVTATRDISKYKYVFFIWE